MDTIEILERLIAFDTVSRNSNLDLIHFISELLASSGIEPTLIHDETGAKANLFATAGTDGGAGVMLSGHTDVVPVDGQEWTKAPFKLTQEGGRLFGRGAADMKGFVACAISAALRAAGRDLKTPLHLAFSYDEEIGCVGVHSMIDMLAKTPVRPAMCIVGEPTSLAVATGHKGKTALRATCRGREGHSALAPLAFNALHLGADFISLLRARQDEIAATGEQDADYDIPYTTLHAGKITGGVALNIVPNLCEVDFEIRNIAQDDPGLIIENLLAGVEAFNAAARQNAPEAGISINVTNSYPGLNTPTDAGVVEFVKSLSGANATNKVAFGTEGGLFSQRIGVPTVICGPGSMAQGHKPDEYVEVEQIKRCDKMMDALIERLVEGV